MTSTRPADWPKVVLTVTIDGEAAFTSELGAPTLPPAPHPHRLVERAVEQALHVLMDEEACRTGQPVTYKPKGPVLANAERAAWDAIAEALRPKDTSTEG